MRGGGFFACVLWPLERDDNGTAQTVLSCGFSSPTKRQHENMRSHDALDNAAFAEPLADMEMAVPVFELGRLDDIGNCLEITRGHRFNPPAKTTSERAVSAAGNPTSSLPNINNRASLSPCDAPAQSAAVSLWATHSPHAPEP